jgi:arabinogalactan endo-1,4-beta-galactosidase
MRSLVILVLLFGWVKPVQSQGLRAVDVSFLSEMEEDGVIYRDADGNDIEDPRVWMASQGVNLVRLKLWNAPADLRQSLLGVTREAAKWDALCVPILLDVHFSDTWADPGQQAVPKAWQGMSFDALQNAMVCWLHCALEALASQGIEPAMVQLGNEIDSGMMWPHGALDQGFGPLSSLLAAGHDAVEAVFPDCQVVVHVSNLTMAPWFFEGLSEAGYTPDVVAVSQYSKWHLQDLDDVSEAILSLNQSTGLPVFIAETAYAWTTDWADWTDNLWWFGDETPGYPFTPEGQSQYLMDLHNVVEDLGPTVCLGWCYWAPDWVASEGATSTEGSAWENAALFDFDWTALPAWEVFSQP